MYFEAGVNNSVHKDTQQKCLFIDIYIFIYIFLYKLFIVVLFVVSPKYNFSEEHSKQNEQARF